MSVINNKWGYELVHMFIVWQPVAVEWRRGDTVRHAAMVVGTLAWMVMVVGTLAWMVGATYDASGDTHSKATPAAPN